MTIRVLSIVKGRNIVFKYAKKIKNGNILKLPIMKNDNVLVHWVKT